jgi:uncharacterized protein YbaR (Trm112 family)
MTYLKKSVEELYDLLACPIDKSELSYDKIKSSLSCKKCSRIYLIKEGIPLMLVTSN